MADLDIAQLLLNDTTDDQKEAIRSVKRRVLVVAGAGSGKTEVMARRIAWWIGVDKIPKDKIVAFTFTERAAEEMKFRIRSWVEKITPQGEEVSLGGMYVGTIHGFCITKIREYWPDEYHNYDILDESSRAALVLRGYSGLLGLKALQNQIQIGQYATVERFLLAYDQLHEHNQFKIKLPTDDPPIQLGANEREWCKQAKLLTTVGKTPAAKAFALSAARYYANLRCRHFLDFSTSQSEFVRRLEKDPLKMKELADLGVHLLVDESQDINPIQRHLMNLLVGQTGRLTAVGDHRQSIYGFRGAKVEIIAELWEELKKSSDGEVVDLRENFRSTPRIIELANRWAGTIQPLRSMSTPAMLHGRKQRKDFHPSHVALIGFPNRNDEAKWIAEAVRALVPSEQEGTLHDKKDGNNRGLALSDIAVLVRSSTDVRTYMEALESSGIPAVVKAGPDLFSQPEILLMIAALAISAGVDAFVGSDYNPKSLPNRIRTVLGCTPVPETVLRSAATFIRRSGLAFDRKAEDRLLFAAHAINLRLSKSESYSAKQVESLRTLKLKGFLTSRHKLRRVFPQELYHMLLAEACVEAWDTEENRRGQTAMFHLGALSGLITGIETPGWTNVSDYHWQIIGLCQYGAEEGRAGEQPLMVQPDAVTISTIHGVKGLEFPAVFLADVNARRFPSNFAKRKPVLPLDGTILRKIDIAGLADNDNYDGERRLMYVAVTRAERFLIISHSGSAESKFIVKMRELVSTSGGTVTANFGEILEGLKYIPMEYRRDVRLSTSFSDLRYYLKCPHDFYFRKVLGFAPTIDQAFGYGRGVHNLMRAIHSNPKKWAKLAKDEAKLKNEIRKLIDKGLFYLRYTTGEPAENMHEKGIKITAEYIKKHADELERLVFEPEKKFETLIEYENEDGGALISGAIDVIRQDDPPRVTLIDFKSGHPDSDKHQNLDEDEMKLQVGIYAVAAKKEMEFQPEKGLVRYLGADEGERSEMEVPLDEGSVRQAKDIVSKTTVDIRKRAFHKGPLKKEGDESRCPKCDFLGLCGMPDAVAHKKTGR